MRGRTKSLMGSQNIQFICLLYHSKTMKQSEMVVHVGSACIAKIVIKQKQIIDSLGNQILFILCSKSLITIADHET